MKERMKEENMKNSKGRQNLVFSLDSMVEKRTELSCRAKNLLTRKASFYFDAGGITFPFLTLSRIF